LLKQVPESRLVLIYNGGGKPWLDDMINKARSSAEIPFSALRTMANLEYARRAFADEGLLPGRVSIMGRSPTNAIHLQHYLNFDIALDPFPYNGTTTTFESLWMGVPVIALHGDCHASRVSAGILASLGFEGLVGSDHDGYLNAAAQLASDRGRLASMRGGLRSIMSASSLMNAPGFTANLESAYRSMWESWCNR
jgi:predicted O-linked N-acetylglucosamine transferase (SPINDLY family)